MGLEDRSYYQERPSYGGQTRSIVATLMMINGAIYLFDNFIMGPQGILIRTAVPLISYLSLPSDFYLNPLYYYRLLTAGFAHSPMIEEPGIWHIVVNMYGLWLFGRDVEQVYGRKEFLRIYIMLILAASAIWALIQNLQQQPASMIGASGAVMGVMMLYILHFPHRKFFMMFIPVPVPAWVLGLFYVFMDLQGALGRSGSGTAFSAHLAGAAAAYLYFRSGIRLTNLFSFEFSLDALKPKPKLKVHRPKQHSQLDADADRILDKVHQHGADSISDEERQILEDYSRRLRDKHR